MHVTAPHSPLSRVELLAIPYAGKKVCVVSAGNSAADIGSDVCRTAERVVMAARSPVPVTPHLIRGVSFNDISR